MFGAPGIATGNKCLTSSNKKLLGAKGIATRSKDAIRGSWHRYWEQEATSNDYTVRQGQSPAMKRGAG